MTKGQTRHWSGRRSGLCGRPARRQADSPSSRRPATALALVVCVFLSVVGAWAQGPEGAAKDAPSDASLDKPQAVVERLHEALLASMRLGKQSSFDDRLAVIDPVVRGDFDMTMIARLVLGRSWSTLSKEDRQRFLDTYTRYIVSNYAAEFDLYNDQRFEMQSVKEQRAGVAIVSSVLHTRTNKTHRFDYQLRLTKGHWRIVNVAVDGVSDLAVKRAQYRSVIKKKNGFQTLLNTLESRIRDFTEGRDVDS